MNPDKNVKKIAAILMVFGSLLFQSFMNWETLSTDIKYIPLEDHLIHRRVNVKGKSLGGHQENCMTLNFQNLTSDSIFIRLEPGRRLIAKDSIYQDILIVKENNIIISPLATSKITAYG